MGPPYCSTCGLLLNGTLACAAWDCVLIHLVLKSNTWRWIYYYAVYRGGNWENSTVPKIAKPENGRLISESRQSDSHTLSCSARFIIHTSWWKRPTLHPISSRSTLNNPWPPSVIFYSKFCSGMRGVQESAAVGTDFLCVVEHKGLWALQISAD